MAAKKKTAAKPAKRATKKVAKKKVTKKKTVAKKAKKVTKKKVAKKAVKKAVKKKAAKKAKKVAKKATKKTAKKAVKKKAAKKKVVVKKAVKKPSVVKKPAATPAKPAPAAKKKPAAKKPLKGFVNKQRQRLLDLRDGIIDAMAGVTNDTLKNTDGMESASGGMHTGDAGSDAYDRDFALNLLAKEQDALSEIEQAIQRCESGKYGICEMSGERIPNERLEAIPFARYTVQCQAKWEQEHGNMRRANGSTEFGFSNGSMR